MMPIKPATSIGRVKVRPGREAEEDGERDTVGVGDRGREDGWLVGMESESESERERESVRGGGGAE